MTDPTDANPPSRPPPEPRRRRGGWAGVFHSLIHGLWSLLVLAAGLLGVLWVFGLPEPLTRRVLERLDGDGFQVGVQRVLLNLPEGLALERFTLNGPEPLGREFLRAERVEVGVDWLELCRRRPAFRDLHVRAASLRWPYAAPSAQTTHVWRTAGLDLELRHGSNAVDVVVQRALSAGIAVQASGRVARMTTVAPAGPTRTFSWAWLSALASNSLAAPAWLEVVRAEAAALRQGEPPRLSLQFEVDPRAPSAGWLAWEATGTRTFIRRGVVDGWSCRGAFEDGVLTVSDLSLRRDAGTARARAAWRVATGLVSAELESDLPPGHVLGLLPPGVAAGLARQGVRSLENVRLELRVADAPVAEWAHHLQGRVTLGSMRWRTVAIRELSARFAVAREGVTVDDARAVVGEGSGAGVCTGRWFHTWQGDYRGDLDLNVDPRLAAPLLSVSLSNFVSRFTFSNGPPRGVVRVAGEARPDSLTLDGTLSATNFTYQGVAVRSLQTDMRYTNGGLVLDHWMLERPEGLLKGRLGFDFNADAQDVDMVGTIDPEALKQLIGPGFQEALDFTRFRGPAVIGARGRYAGLGPGTELQVDIEAEQAALQWFTCDRLTLQLTVTGAVYRLSNIVARAYGGTLTGAVRVVLFTNEAPTYAVTAGAAGVDLARLARAIKPVDSGEQQGKVSGWVQLRGRVGAGQGATVVGTGQVVVAEGQLNRIRLLGGLSTLLSSISPGLGMAAQTDFQCDYVIRNGRCETRNGMLSGAVLSIKVQGAYYFDQRVRFVVEVKPLRSGPVASVVRWVTSPVTKLFAFRLSGTLADPRWRPDNLPKEMFLIFD